MVIDAMFYLLDEDKIDHKLLMDKLNTTYRSSLGPVCCYLNETYKVKGSSDHYVPRISELSEGGRWQMYDTHVRPVLTDINNNSFIGWIPGIPNVERLLTLQLLCFQLEKLVASIDLVLKRDLGEYLKPKDALVYSITCREDFNDENPMPSEVLQLIQNNQRLEMVWDKWKKLVLSYKGKKSQAA